jgi:hypothetical protein
MPHVVYQPSEWTLRASASPPRQPHECFCSPKLIAICRIWCEFELCELEIVRYKILSRTGVIYRWVLDWMIWFIDTLYIQNLGLQAIQRHCYSTHFTVHRCTHTLGFSVFTSRILATNLSQSHCQFKSHVKSSCHSLIPFLSLFWNCQFWRLESIQFLCSQAHVLAGWRLETRLSYCLLRRVFWLCPFITPWHGLRRTHGLCC